MLPSQSPLAAYDSWSDLASLGWDMFPDSIALDDLGRVSSLPILGGCTFSCLLINSSVRSTSSSHYGRVQPRVVLAFTSRCLAYPVTSTRVTGMSLHKAVYAQLLLDKCQTLLHTHLPPPTPRTHCQQNTLPPQDKNVFAPPP